MEEKIIRITDWKQGEAEQTKYLPVHEIAPSPFQYREYFDKQTLKELAANIERDGLIEPIVVRWHQGGYELIAGERRLRAVRDYSEQKLILARIIQADDLQARRKALAENLQREDLPIIHEIRSIVELVDVEFGQDDVYMSRGKTPLERVTKLLSKLDSISFSKRRVSSVSGESEALFRKFAEQVDKIFRNLPKPLEWRTFYRHDLNLLMDISSFSDDKNWIL